MEDGLLKRVEECLWPKGPRRDVWMIVDSARDPRIFGLLLECFYSRHTCLFAGTLAPELEAVAPYLVQLEYDDAKTRKFLNHAWGNNWGVFLKCDTSLKTLKQHLRRFLTVCDSAGKRLLFRYYDPRVLKVYLPTCTGEELQSIFGSVECFYMEDTTPQNLLQFRLSRGGLMQGVLPLGADALPTSPATEGAGVLAAWRPRTELLKIREAQLAVFSQAEALKFEEWMIAHLRQFFPKKAALLGEPKLRETIQYGIQRASAYGLTAKRDACKYIDVMFVVGADFDRDKQLSWASSILAKRTAPITKSQALVEAAQKHVKYS